MATLTIANFMDGLVLGTAEYDASTLRISSLTMVNNSDSAVHVTAVRLSDGLSYAHRFDARSNTFRLVPTSPAAARLPFFVNAAGKIDGIEFRVLWPYP